MGILYLPIIIVYVVLGIFILKALKKDFPHKKHLPKIALVIYLVIPTYDIIITNILAGYYCLSTPSTYIKQKIEYPESIYWEDNVYPGFNKEDRELMIMNYLDGDHLKTMALNGDDGKVYVYHLEKPIFNEITKGFSEQELYKSGFKKYAQIVMQNEKIYTKQTMPKMNYTVTSNELNLNFFAKKFLYSDKTQVIDNNTSKTIAYNERYMRFFYNTLPDFAGGRYYSDSMCGDSYFWFDYHVFKFQGVEVRNKHQLNINKYLYKKYIKGKK